MRRVPLALVLLVLVACGPAEGSSTRLSPGARTPAEVTRVVDGDTIHVLLDVGDVTIRFIGVDTPEAVAPGEPVACFGPAASRFTDAELRGRTVELEFDRRLIDPFDRTLAYVWLGDELFNETLVRRGFAEAKTYPPNTRYQQGLDAAEDEARDERRGLWGACS